MTTTRPARPLLVLGCAVFSLQAPAGAAFADDPLFADHAVLAVEIHAPLTELFEQRDAEVELPGRFLYTAADGAEVELSVQLRARGNFRRRDDVCDFPPLRLNFRKSEVEGLLFDKQDKLKLVTHCSDRRDGYEQNVLLEYLAYRIFSTLTEASYRTRLLQIRYVDDHPKAPERLRYGIVIEHRDRLSARLGLPFVTHSEVPSRQLDAAHTNRVSVFEFMIANTDFSARRGREGEPCCHNVNLFGTPDPGYVPVPYDFDMSGLVDAPYAAPNPRFGLSSVRRRLYRGRCIFNDQLPATMAEFVRAEPAVMELVAGIPGLDNRHRKLARNFLIEFYKTAKSAKRTEILLIKKCI